MRLVPPLLGEGVGRGSFQMVRAAEQSHLGSLRHCLTGSWLLPTRPPPNPPPEGRETFTWGTTRSLLDSDALMSTALPQGGGTIRPGRHWRGRIHSGRMSCHFPATPNVTVRKGAGG